MKLKFKDTIVDLIVPSTYTDLASIISSKFEVQDFSTLIKTLDGIYQVSSTPEYQNIPSDSIVEVEVCSPQDPLLSNLNFSKIDSIDTCTSHERSDSDGSKRSENLNASVNISQVLINDPLAGNVSQLIQTDKIEYSEATVSHVIDTNEFQSQFDEPLIIEIDVLEQFFKNFLMDNRKVAKKNLYVHNGFVCFKCKITPIVGVRFECAECRHHFCEKCESSGEHPHDLLVHKGITKVPQSVSKEETVIKKIVDMGLGDQEKVRSVAKKYLFDLSKTVEELLFN